MSDFASAFWPYYIAIISVVSIVACAVFLKSQSIRRVEGAGLETTGHVWDEDLKEWNNPLPRWWSWLFYITIVFGLVYLVLYPGLVAYAGRLGWTSSGQYEPSGPGSTRLMGRSMRSTRAWTPARSLPIRTRW
jgi:cytochrome c oxidase cbb3-type subunit 3